MTFKCATFLAIVAASLGSAHAVNYTGGVYVEDLDGLPLTGSNTATGRGPHDLNNLANWTGIPGSTDLMGWTGSNHLGSSGNTELRVQDGSLSGSAGRGLLSVGTAGSLDRALGVLPTSNQISRFGLSLNNTSLDTFVEFTLSYFGEQWRAGDTNVSNNLTFEYSLSAADINDDLAFTPIPSLNFSSPITTGGNLALDGNDPGNREFLIETVGGLNWGPGTTLTVRWSMDEVSGQDTALAIDDLRFSAAVPEPSTLSLCLIGLLLVGNRRRLG